MSDHRRYEQCLSEMYGLRRFGIKLELTTIQTILAGLGSPQDRFPTIHLAGTNGKGSIAAMLSTILHQAGYRVGRYTSPHLVSFNERITVNNIPITNDRVVAAYKAVQVQHGHDRQPTFFEYTTAMAFHEFAQQQVEVAIIETGMGGQYDATNVINPDLSIISNISLEHQTYLGRTLAAIAGEKAGIIKQDTPLITGVSQQQARDRITTVARRRNAPVYIRGTHFKTRRNGSSGQFTYYGLGTVLRKLRSSLAGAHQQVNASLALAACEIMNERSWNIPETAIRQGLATTAWPARLEIVSRDPFILIDGAHNLMAARSLADYLRQSLDGREITLIIGILDDKAYLSILKTLVPLCRTTIVTRAETGRAIAPATLEKAARGLTRSVVVTDTVEMAVNQALSEMTGDQALCIAGSLYVAGDARRVLIKKGFI
ncbi:MAG: folylpolyglutamate synthase/dihydrofolate synthase family protein [Desulfosudaceae bacterium]